MWCKAFTGSVSGKFRLEPSHMRAEERRRVRLPVKRDSKGFRVEPTWVTGVEAGEN